LIPPGSSAPPLPGDPLHGASPHGLSPHSDRLRHAAPWFAFAALCLAADLWTKHLVFYPHVLEPGFREGMPVPSGRVASWWDTILVYNLGVTFGSFSGVPGWTKAVLTAAVIGWMAWKLWTLPAGKRLQAASLAMIVGGAVGNLYDRTLRPAIEPDQRPGVRDFLDWHLPEHWDLAQTFRQRGWSTHWYTSNVADVLIVCGVSLLAWCILREPDEGAAPSKSTAAAS
jgi:signal peptidase II